MAQIIPFPYKAAAYLTPEERERLHERRALRQAVEAARGLPGQTARLRPCAWGEVVVQRMQGTMNYGLVAGDSQALLRLSFTLNDD